MPVLALDSLDAASTHRNGHGRRRRDPFAWTARHGLSPASIARAWPSPPSPDAHQAITRANPPLGNSFRACSPAPPREAVAARLLNPSRRPLCANGTPRVGHPSFRLYLLLSGPHAPHPGAPSRAPCRLSRGRRRPPPPTDLS